MSVEHLMHSIKTAGMLIMIASEVNFDLWQIIHILNLFTWNYYKDENAGLFTWNNLTPWMKMQISLEYMVTYWLYKWRQYVPQIIDRAIAIFGLVSLSCSLRIRTEPSVDNCNMSVWGMTAVLH